jgi:two-component sensor histidine kinase
LQSARGPVLSLIHFSTPEDQIRVLNPNTRNWLQTIRPKEADINILLKAIDQRSPEPIHYLYQLQPKDKDWISTYAGGNFQFYSLPPGRYNFLASARNRDGKMSDIIEIPFRILTPFYKQWWFGLFLLFSIGVIIYGFYRWRLNVQLKKNRQLTESLKTQNKILRLEQAAGRLQMNPHFIFNALQSIQSSISEGDRDKARNDLQAFSKLMRGYLDHARAERIMLEDEINLLNQYLRVEQDLKGNCFDYEIHVPETIDPTFMEIPAMLLQPFVENAVKHGIPANGIKGLIKVEFDWHGKYLCCTISDNGPGFHSKKSSGDHQSAGMEITRERLQAFFKNTSLNPLIIKSGSGNQNECAGTEIQVLLPTEF